MSQVVLDETVLASLRDTEQAEIVDRSGRTVGHFLSDKLFQRLVYDWANAQVSDEELQRRLAEPARPLAEILAELEAQ